MNILLVAATLGEIQPVLDFLELNSESKNFFDYTYNGHKITPLITGVGQFMMGFAIPRFVGIKDVDLAINIGISGAYDRSIEIGEVVEITSDRFGDLGAELADGTFNDLYDLQLSDSNLYPMVNGCIVNAKKTKLRGVNACTVNTVNGTVESIDKIIGKYSDIEVESMEGAAFMYACKALDVEYIQIKGISNYVEKRDRSKWNIGLAVKNVNDWLIDYLKNNLSY